MKERLALWTETETLTDVFKTKWGELKMTEAYGKYIQNYNHIPAALHYLTRRYPEFARILRDFHMEQTRQTNLNIESFLIQPVQRLPRYVLLLRDMLKYTNENHQDQLLIPVVIDQIEASLQLINSGINKEVLDHVVKQIEIEKCISGEFRTIVHPQRRYIREGLLFMTLEKGQQNERSSLNILSNIIKTPTSMLESLAKNRSNQYWFLFDDIMVNCMPKKHPTDTKLFKYFGQLSLFEVSDLQELSGKPSKKHPNEHGFSLFIAKDKWRFYAQSVDERDLWFNDLKKLLLEIPSKQSRLFG